MKRIWAALVTISFFAALADGQHQLDVKVPDSIEHDMAGHVKMVKEVSRKRDLFGKGELSLSEEIRTYDEKGNRLIKKVIDEVGQLKTIIEYIYDDNGCFVKEISEDKEEDASEEFTVIIDVERRIILKENITTHEKKATLYTKAGYEDRIKWLDADGNVTKSVEALRWPNNKDRKYSYYDGDHKPTSTVWIDWNRDGTPKEMRFQDHVKDNSFTIEYDYSKKDALGNWTARTETTTLYEKGKTIPLTRVEATRVIEYY